MSTAIGRWSELNNTKEIHDLEAGMDFRLPQYRREVFLKFYEFHTRYNSHPGGVYYLMPYLLKDGNMEDKLWFAFINGNTQNPITSYIIWKEFPTPEYFIEKGGKNWFDKNWQRLQWDVDRRYQKKDFPSNVHWYARARIESGSQFSFLTEDFHTNEYENFETLWRKVRGTFPTFGRLSAFSYLEYLRIMGLNQDCNNLFLEDLDGSKSHRNGLCIVLGRDELDWHDNKVTYTREQIKWLDKEAQKLLWEASLRFPGTTYYTLESALCTYKSWHRLNRRYPNVYNDMMYDRIVWAQERWPEISFQVFREARREYLPTRLRREDRLSKDPGLVPVKQNWYLNNGCPVMMSGDFPCFDNEFDRMVWSA